VLETGLGMVYMFSTWVATKAAGGT